MKWTIGVLLVAACGGAHAADAKPQAGSCESFANAFDNGAKELAYIEAGGVGDNSAARESNRLLERVIATNVMQMNLNLMQLNKCAAPKQPVYAGDYGLDAMKCSNAVMRGRLSGDKSSPPECDRGKWTK
jgi:hypothetical protein